MNFTDIIIQLIIGIISSAIFAGILIIFLRSKKFISIINSNYKLAEELNNQGIVELPLKREQYAERLPVLLTTAKHSIMIISVSLKLTNDEGDLIDVFRKKLSQDNFRISISLLAPKSNASKVLSSSLNLDSSRMEQEIQKMIKELYKFKESLPSNQKQRLNIVIHESLPMGSAILIDANPDQGTIQIETKLYKAARTESFGFKIVGPSEFYTRNYRSWNQVFDDSRAITDKDLS